MCSKTLKCVSDLKGWECIKNMKNDMARNTERDEREATRRKEQLMKAGFKLSGYIRVPDELYIS